MPPKRKRVDSSDEEVVVEKKIQPRRRQQKKIDSDEESEEEVIKKPTRAATKRQSPRRKTKKEESEDEEEEEEEEEVIKPTKRESSRPQRKKTKSEEEEATSEWQKHESVYYYNDPKSNTGEKVAAFDMDHTLLVPKTGKVFAVGRNDWAWYLPCIPERLRELHNDGYKVVIFSNQGGVEKGKVKIGDICGKINDIAKAAGVPICALLATADDKYRKPSSDFWNFFENNLCIDSPDKSQSFFCGDFAGRVENWNGKGAKKDKGCSDRKFARNIGVKFYTPEELFLKSKVAEFTWRGVDPKTLPTVGKRSDKEEYHSSTQEMIVSVGFPASGKSTFATKYLVPNGYVRVNMDTLKTAAKCIKVCKEALEEGKSVVIDNTNGPAAKRAEWIRIADAFGIPVRCFHFTTEEDLCKHMNEFREKITNGEQKHVPSLVYNTFKKSFAEPKKSEGFKEIVKINFVREHPDEEHSRCFEEFTERIR